MKKINLLIIVLCFFLTINASAITSNQDYKDSTLSELNNEIFDSLTTPSFFKLQKKGLESAINTNNEYYYYIFRHDVLSHYWALNDKNNFLNECDSLIAHYKKRIEKKSEKYLYDTWATKFDRLQMWGQHKKALSIIHDMSDYAQKHNDDIGIAVTNYCFGHIYLDNRQCEEAEKFYSLSYRQLLAKKEYYRALRAGFNLMAIQMNLNDPKKGLKISDNNAELLKQWQTELGSHVNSVILMKQALYRFRLLFLSGNFKDAVAQKDTMLYYNNISRDPSQQEIIQYAIAGFEQRRGNYDIACQYLDSLIVRFKKEKDFLKVARYRYALANVQQKQGYLNAAIDNYKQYVVDRDSANISSTNRQLNKLTKEFQLKELQHANELSKVKEAKFKVLTLSIFIISIFIFGICILLFFHAKTLRHKNIELTNNIQKQVNLETRAEELANKVPEKNLTKSAIRFRRIKELLSDKQLLTDTNLNTETLVKLLGTNRKYIADAISENTDGLSISNYINNQRLNLALEMLKSDTKLTLVEIQEQTGFSSQGNFYSAFNKEYGMSPGQYRKYFKLKK